MANEVPISGIKKRGVLDELAQAAKTLTITLEESIRSAKSNISSPTFQKGRIVIATSGNGQSASFDTFGKEFTQDNLFALHQEFLEILRDTIAAGTPDGATPLLIDALFTAMCDDDRLRGIRSQMGDFSGLNTTAFR